MYDNETKNQFIELRAEGLSLDAISSRLNVPRATLGRWHHESVEQIQRLRSLQWHLLEEQIGHRLEDSLQRIAQRIRKCEDELDKRDPHYRKAVELVRIIRDSRREYLQLRALLLAPLQPTRGRAACLTSIDQPKRDKTRQNPDALDTTSPPTNDLQQPEPATSHSDNVAADVRRQVTSPESFDSPATHTPPTLNHTLNLNPNPSSVSQRLCGAPPDIQPLINTPRGEPAQPLVNAAASPHINTPLQRGEPEQPLVNAAASPHINTPLQRGEPEQPLVNAAASPLINTPLQRGEPVQRVSDTTASAVYSQSSQIIHPNPQPVGVPPSGGPSTSVPQRVAESSDIITANNGSPALPLPPRNEAVSAPSTPKKHKPYWLNGHYYENPEYPENIARAICARQGRARCCEVPIYRGPSAPLITDH